jgi:transcription antitermination factor NusG
MTETLAPYFPGYLFVQLDRERQIWRPINSTFGVLRLVTGPDGPSAAPSTLIETLKAASDGQGVLNLTRAWTPGGGVRIASGPFADQLGVVDSLSGPDRVRVLLSMMNAEVLVLVPTTNLRPMGAWSA